MFPKLFDLFGFSVHTYGLLIALAFLFAIRDAMRRSSSTDISKDHILDLGLWVLLASILGGKLLLIALDWKFYFGDPRRLLSTLRAAGVFYGGFILSVLAVIVFVRRHGLRFFRLADVLVPSVPLGEMFARLGCFSAGCCHGAECRVPWAVTFKSPYANENTGVPLGTPLHPTQLYLALTGLVLWLGLRWFFKRRGFDGQVFALYLMSYGCLRFIIEFFRGDDRGMFFRGALSTSQVIAVAAVAAGTALIFLLRKRRVPDRARG